MMAFMKMLCGMILLKLGRPTFAFSITAGSLKLNGRLHSPKAAAYVAEALSEHLDDMIVFCQKAPGEDNKRGPNVRILSGTKPPH